MLFTPQQTAQLRLNTAATTKHEHCVVLIGQNHLISSTTSSANMSAPNKDDLEPEATEGFKVGEKKTIDEYQQLGESPLSPQL